jgi:hypothetical protein
MTTAKTLFGLVAAALVAALTIAAGTATAAVGPTITVGTGCAAQCITKALVTVTATSAKVELQTTVLAHLSVYVTKQTAASATGGGLTSSQTRKVSISAFSPNRTASFFGLEPDTTYAILVKATDLKNQVASQQGTFKTLPIKTAGLGGPDTIDSGVGCSAQCITKAQISQQAPAASIARIDMATSTDARIQVIVSRDKPVQTASGVTQYAVVSNQLSPGLTKSFKTQVGGLGYGTTYYVVVRAKDAQGRMNIRQGSFRTVSATARVTIHKIKVVNDGDKGRNTGELYFRLWLGNDVYDSWYSGRKELDSGAVFDVKAKGSPHTGFSFPVSANGDAKFDMSMLGEECDAVLKKNCILEASGPSIMQYAIAGGRFDVSDILSHGALPGWYGTGVAAPAGHDGYFVFGTTDKYVKFYVLATLDIDVDWP